MAIPFGVDDQVFHAQIAFYNGGVHLVFGGLAFGGRVVAGVSVAERFVQQGNAVPFFGQVFQLFFVEVGLVDQPVVELVGGGLRSVFHRLHEIVAGG